MLSIKELGIFYSASFSALDFNRDPQGLYEPIRHVLSTPGKHIRPMLVLISCEAFGGRMDDAVPAGHAMELFHCFTLVHDDIMDDATLRRGTPTVYRKYGINTGILAGDALCIYAYKYLCAAPVHLLPAVLQVFNTATLEIMEGQQMDVDFEQRLDVTIPEYIRMIEYKTSVLLACSMQIGAIIGGASVEDQHRIYEFGMKLGVSFQIKDDWLDTFGESDKVGKKAGGDIVQNKKTYLLITLLKDVNDADRKELLNLLGEKDENLKVTGVKALYAKYQISEKTLDKVDELYEESMAAFAAIRLPDAQKNNLKQMSEMIRNRTF